MKIKDLSGQKLGKLLVIELAGRNKQKNCIWKCLCDCGKEHFISSSNLQRKKTTRSCGCCKGFPINADYDFSFLKWLFNYHKRNAKTRNLNFILTIEQVKELVQKPCYYCNYEGKDLAEFWRTDKINRIHKKRDTKLDPRSLNVKLIGNGIDRVDSSIGYEKENCVSCCVVCNRMKLDHDAQFFYNKIKDIHSFLTQKGLI